MSALENIVWAKQQKCGSPLEKLLLIYLAERCGDAARCDVEYSDLADFCHCTKEQALDAVEDLARRRLLWTLAGGVDGVDLVLPWWHGGDGFKIGDESPTFPWPIREVLMHSQQGLCWYCGCDLASHPLTPHIEHQVPTSRGGPNTISNIVLSCAPCNSAKNDKTVSEFRAYVIKRDRLPKDFHFRWEYRG